MCIKMLEKQVNGTLKNGCILMLGPGGSGKTYIYKTLCHLFRGYGIKFKTSAWMGIAANLLPDGRTMHKTFGLPFELDKNSVTAAKPNNRIGREIIETQVFIVDEISMVPNHALEIIDKKCRELMNNELPYGGKVFIAGGDLRQILPVKKRAGRSELVGLSITKSEKLMPYFSKNVFELKKNMRVLKKDKDVDMEDLDENDELDALKMLENEEYEPSVKISKRFMTSACIEKCTYNVMKKVTVFL